MSGSCRIGGKGCANYRCPGAVAPKNDSVFNGTDDLVEPRAGYDGRKLSCGFRRKLNTGDQNDVVLKKG